MMAKGKTKALAVALLTFALAVAVAVLAGVGAANPGHGKSAGSAQYQYGTSAGKQYGLHRVAVCHKGHTIMIAAPALKAHLNHGDAQGVCKPPAMPTTQASTTKQHGNPSPTTLLPQSKGKGHSK
jgi:hypothetical protein